MADIVHFPPPRVAAPDPAGQPVNPLPAIPIEDSFVALAAAVEKIAALTGRLSAAVEALEKHAARNSADIARIASALGTILQQGAYNGSD